MLLKVLNTSYWTHYPIVDHTGSDTISAIKPSDVLFLIKDNLEDNRFSATRCIVLNLRNLQFYCIPYERMVYVK